MYQDLDDEIWESLLKAAVIANSQNEIKDYPPEQEINRIVLPEHYELRMRRILKYCRYRKHIKLSLRYGKKIASVIFLIMGISFSLLLSFDEVRAACQKVIIEIYERYIRYSYTSDLSLEDSLVSFGYVPTGKIPIPANDTCGNILCLNRKPSASFFLNLPKAEPFQPVRYSVQR